MSNTLEARIVADASGLIREFSKLPGVIESAFSKVASSLDNVVARLDKMSAKSANLGTAITKSASDGFDNVSKKSKAATDVVVSETTRAEKAVTDSQKRINDLVAKTMKAMETGEVKRDVFQTKLDFLTKEGVALTHNQKFLTAYSAALATAIKQQDALNKSKSEFFSKNYPNGISTNPAATGPNIKLNTGMNPNNVGMGMNTRPNPDSPYYNPALHATKQQKEEMKQIAAIPLDKNVQAFIVAWERAQVETKKYEDLLSKAIKTYEPLMARMSKEQQSAFTKGLAEGVKKTMQDATKPPPISMWKTFFGLIKEEAIDTAALMSYRFGLVGRAVAGVVQGMMRAHSQVGAGGAGGILAGQSGMASLGMITALTAGTAAFGVVASGVALVVGNKLAGALAHYTENLSDMSAKTSISIESLSALDHVARMGGLSVQDMQMSLVRFNDKIQESASGSKKMAGVFKELNVEVKDTETTVKPTLKILLETADALFKIGPSSKQTALALDAFGNQGTRLLTIINKGPKAIQELMEEAKNMGLVLSGEAIAASEKYIDSQRKIAEQWRAMKMIIGSELLPAFANLMESLNNAINSPAGKAITAFFTMIAGGVAANMNRAMFDPTQAAKDRIAKLGSEVDKVKGKIDLLQSNSKKYGTADTPVVQKTMKELEGRLSSLVVQQRDAVDSMDALGGVTSKTTTYLDTQSGAIRNNTAATEKWKDMIDSARQSLQGQLTNLEEQAIGMQKGELAAKEFSLGQALIEARQRAIKEGAPAKVIAELEAVYKRMIPQILKATDANMKLKYAMDQLAERTRQFDQDEQDARQSSDDGIKAKRALIDVELDLFNRTDTLTKGVTNLSDAYNALVSSVDPGKAALQGFTKSLDDQEKSLRALIATAEKEATGSELTAEAEAAIQVLKALLARVQEAQNNPQGALSSKVAEEMAAAHRDSMLAMMLESEALKVITTEERINLMINKEIVEWKKKGVDLTSAENEELLKKARALAGIRAATEDALQRQKDAIQTIERALQSGVENMQSAFADMWYDIFDPESKEDFGKRFAKSILQGWLRSISQIAGVMTTSLMDSMVQSITGMSMKQLITKFSTGIVSSLGIGGSAAIAATPDTNPVTHGIEGLDAEFGKLIEGAKTAGKTLLDGVTASADTFMSKMMTGIPTFVTTLGSGLLQAVQGFGDWMSTIVDKLLESLSSIDFGGGGGESDWSWLTDIFSSVGSYFAMGAAKGGVNPYGSGNYGMVKQPTTMITRMGENAPREFEAIVPLPDNRSIPVTFTGGGTSGRSGAQSNQSPVNVDPAPTVVEVHFHNPIDPQSMKTTYAELVQAFRKDKKAGGQLTTIIKGVSKQ